MSNSIITIRTLPDRTLEQLTDSGWVKVEIPASTNVNDDVDNPAYDPDNMPLTAEQLAKRRNIPPIRSLRRKLVLTQEEFAETYMIPIGTLRDWEQHRSEPDAPARAYLKVIAADPTGVAHALKATARPAAE